MNEAASTISGVVIAMSSSTNSPKVLSTIAEVRGVPASGVHIIDSSKRASEMLKPLLAGRAKSEVANIMFIATENTPSSYLRQFETFSDKLGSPLLRDFADTDLTELDNDQLREWAETGTFTQEEGDLIDDLFLDEDEEEEEEETATEAPSTPEPDQPEEDPIIGSLPQSASGPDSADGRPQPSGPAPIHIPQSSDGDVDLSSLSRNLDDDDPIDLTGFTSPPRKADPTPATPAPEGDPPAPDADAGMEAWIQNEGDDDIVDLPGTSGSQWSASAPPRQEQLAFSDSPPPQQQGAPQQVPSVPLPPNLRPHNNDLASMPAPSQDMDSAPTPRVPHDQVQEAFPMMPPLPHRSPQPPAPPHRGHDLEDEVFGSPTPAPDPPADQVPPAQEAHQGSMVSGAEGRTYRDYLSNEDRRVQARTQEMNSVFGHPDLPDPREAKETERQHYGSPRRSAAPTAPWEESVLAKIIKITGSHGGAGKTSLAWVMANAAALAMRTTGNDRPVYLIEVDYRNPKLVSRLGKESQSHHLGHFADALEEIQRRGGPNQTRDITKALLANTIQQPDTGLFVLPAAHSHEDMDRWDANKMKSAIAVAVGIASRVASHVFLDSGTLTARNFEPLDENLINMATTAVMVTDASNYEEARRAVGILRHPGTKRISRPASFVNVFMNRTRTDQTDEAASEMRPFPICGVWPQLDELSPGSDSRGWVNAAPADVKNQLLKRAGYALTRMGYTEFNQVFGGVMLDEEVARPSLLRRLLRL